MSAGQPNAAFPSSQSSKVASVFIGDYAAADEGSYFTAWLGATAVGTNAVTTQALATANPILAVYNQQPVGGYNVYMRAIKLRATTVVTGTTSVYHVGVLNPTIATLTALGTALNGPTNVNSNSGTTSRTILYGGVLTATTQASVPGSRIVNTGPVAGIIPIVLDSWIFNFGGQAPAQTFQEAVTTTKIITVACPPVIIAPQWYYAFGVWGPSWQAAAMSFTYDVEFIERPQGQ